MTDCIDFTEAWVGWRLRGRYLVSPDRQRISPERLRGLLWRDELELRRAGHASRRAAEENRRKRQTVKVVVVQLAELQVDGILAG
jgi:hypothetical protein